MSEQIITADRMDEMIRVLFQELKAKGGHANGTDVLAAIEPKLSLTPYEREKTETGRVSQFDGYDFQKLAQELLQAMGYHVAYNAPPGPDGGVDVIAYKDPLGTTAPRIKVQVKHRHSKVTAAAVRKLEGLLRKEGDVGLVVSSGGFTSDALRESRASSKHIETMDSDRLISLWPEHYEKLTETGKALLPLVKVHFLAPPEE